MATPGVGERCGFIWTQRFGTCIAPAGCAVAFVLALLTGVTVQQAYRNTAADIAVTGRALLATLLALLLNRGRDPHLDKMQHSPVNNPAGHRLQKLTRWVVDTHFAWCPMRVPGSRSTCLQLDLSPTRDDRARNIFAFIVTVWPKQAVFRAGSGRAESPRKVQPFPPSRQRRGYPIKCILTMIACHFRVAGGKEELAL